VNQRIIRLPEVRELVGLGKTAIYDKIKTGEFPKPLKLGRVSGWVESDVQAWINAQITASRTPAHGAAGAPAP
jgi:prophage regulatory protein